jgi:5,10-methylenetetrahydrofolate reductase
MFASDELGARCPKHMVYGPCGGVRPDGACELGDRPCPFVDAPLVRWHASEVAPRAWPIETRSPATPAIPSDRPFVITDLRTVPFDLDSIAAVTTRLSMFGDAVLIGEHQNRPDYPPSFLARVVADSGGRPWVTLTCRDRNRIVLEAELEALAHSPILGVHCVTGDARAPSVRPDASQVFDLDSLRLAALARAHGLRVSVAASPAAPPDELRAPRVLEKQRAGAEVCFVNHAGGPGPVAGFVAAAREVGVSLAFIPCVAVFTDVMSAAVLEGFPGLVLDQHEREQVLGAPDPRRAGIDAAVAEAMQMLDIDGVVGINLSGAATSGSELESAAIMAEVAEGVRARDRR